MRYWKRVNAQGEITTVESYSHNLNIPGAVEIAQDEFDAFIATLPKPVLPLELDWKALWQAASSPAAKIEILARKLGMVDA